MKNWQQSLLAGAIIALTACGGSSSSKDKPVDQAPTAPTTPTPPTPVDEISYGRVIDGYLENAIVCIDTNNNLICDTSEVSKTTDSQGRFELKEFEDSAILVQAKAGTTKDQDDGELITTSFIMRAPKGHNGLVTPFTSFQATLLEQGKSADEAAKNLIDSLAITQEKLEKDYIAEKDSQLQLLAKSLILSIQAITRKALSQDYIYAPSEHQTVIESLAWKQLTTENISKISKIIETNGTDKTAQEISIEFLATTDELHITELELEAVLSNDDSINTDQDNDTVPNASDNCPAIANTDQTNIDGDNMGDACDTDKDGDTILNAVDNCPIIANQDQANIDSDSLGDACDNVDNRAFAATNINFDDALDTVTWTLPAEINAEFIQQIKTGTDGIWKDVKSQPAQVDDRAEGNIFIRFKDAQVQTRFKIAESENALTRTPLIKLNAQLERLADNAKHISEDGGKWVCTRDNRAEETVYWSAAPKFHGSSSYDYESITNKKLETLNKDSNTNCGFSNWDYPAQANIKSLVVTDPNDVNSKTWGFDKYFNFMRESNYGYYLSKLNIADERQVILANGDIKNLSSWAYLLPMRKVQTGAELLAQLASLKSDIAAKQDEITALDVELMATMQEGFDAYQTIVSNNPDDITAQLENLITTSYGATNNKLNVARKAAKEALKKLIEKQEEILTFLTQVESTIDFTVKNIDLMVSYEQVQAAQRTYSTEETQAIHTMISNIKSKLENSQKRVEDKINLVKVHSANTTISAQLTAAQTKEAYGVQLTTEANTKANAAKNIRDYAELTPVLDQAKRAIDRALDDLGKADSTSSGTFGDLIGTAAVAGNKSSEALAKLTASSSDFSAATIFNTQNQQNLASVIATRTSLENSQSNIKNLITNSKALSEQALEIFKDSEESLVNVNDDKQSIEIKTETLKTKTDSISDTATAATSYKDALKLFTEEQTLLAQVNQLQTEINKLKAYIDAPSTPDNSITLSLKEYKAELETALSAAQTAADAAHTQALASMDAAWAQDSNLISPSVAQIERKPYYKLDHKGRYTYKDTLQSQGWSCVQQADSIFATNKIWALLKANSNNQQDGINFIEAQAMVSNANTNKLCGKNDWTLPTTQQLISLSTKLVSSNVDGIDKTAFINHIGNENRFSGTDLSTRYGYWTSLVDANNANKQQAFSFPEYGNSRETSITGSIENNNTLDINATIIARLYREEKINPVPTVTAIDSEGRRALTDGSNTVCLRIGNGTNDQVWSKHNTIVDNNADVKGSDIESTLNRLNSHNSDAGICGVTNWVIPTTEQFTAMAMDKSLDFNHKDSGNTYGDYWLNEVDGSYRHVFDIRKLEKHSSARYSSNEYSFRALGTASGNIPAALPIPLAPTNGSVNDTDNNFSWDNVEGYTAANTYEISVDAGKSWSDVTNNPQNVGDFLLPAGNVQVRVKANQGINNTGLTLSSLEAYTGATPCFGQGATEIDGKCYRLYDEKNWGDAKQFCEDEGASLVSKDFSDFNTLGSNLTLNASKNYWLLEPDGTSYAYHFYKHYSGDWRAITSTIYSTSISNQYKFICVK